MTRGLLVLLVYLAASRGAEILKHAKDKRQATHECIDSKPNCKEYGQTVCTEYKDWAEKNCQLFCGVCHPTHTTTPKPCTDLKTNCQEYGMDVCTKYGPWAGDNCRKFCGLCDLTQTFGYYDKCSYKGKEYKTGDTWEDGCDYSCTCQDGKTGHYTCTNKCPLYHDLPPQCTLVATPGQCCLQPVCNFNNKVTKTEGSGIGKDANGIDVCVYKGINYYQGQSWNDGCDLKCTCNDAKQGTYNCQSYCPSYTGLPTDCILEKDPNGCCERPKCTYKTFFGKFQGTGTISGKGIQLRPTPASECKNTIPNCDEYGYDACDKYPGWANDNCAKYCSKCGVVPTPGTDDFCIYDGKNHRQGESWPANKNTVCYCEDAIYGYYRCVNTCPTYDNLPAGCLTLKKVGESCDVVKCSSGTFYSGSTNLQTIGSGTGIQVTGNIPATSSTGSGTGGTGMQPPKLTGCLFNGQLYAQDQQWEEKCLKVCVCKDAATGLFSCAERCPTYEKVPVSCGSMPDPNDKCCTIPNCAGYTAIPVYHQGQTGTAQVKPPNLSVLQSGTYTIEVTLTFTGETVPAPTATGTARPGGIGYCEYKGRHYLHAEKWEDGCKYKCTCQDAYTGLWKCNDRCKTYEELPKQCWLVTDSNDPCCQVPFCIFDPHFQEIYGTGHPGTFTTPHITLKATQEAVITTPRPAYCEYKGVHYSEGQQWYDGCSLVCTCDNAKSGYYRCTNRCPLYYGVPADCTKLPDPKDPICCTIPHCAPKATSSSISGTGEPPTIPPGQITGTGQNQGGTGAIGFCLYKEIKYTQGQKWNDGCQYSCECEDADTGRYRCRETCPRYASLPRQCRLITDFANPCCQRPDCDFQGHSGGISGHGNLTPSPGTPEPKCVYNSATYYQGQTWMDGCSLSCRCEDAVKGLYICNDRCPTFPPIPSQCKMVTDPADPCCQKPDCQFIPTSGSVSGTANPDLLPTLAPAQITAHVPTPKPGQTPNPVGFCIYKGTKYNKGQTWQDGCTYNCECLDDVTGKYKCTERCPMYAGLPPQCKLMKDPSNPCCQTPICDFTSHHAGVTGHGNMTPAPNATPSTGPHLVTHAPPKMCVYKANSYATGQKWYDGCDYTCECENADQGIYRCNRRCAVYNDLPKECHLEADPKDPLCCQRPACNFVPTGNNTSGFLLPTFKPGVVTGGSVVPTPNPLVSPSPGSIHVPLPTDVCVYKGQEYNQGQKWQDGCLYNCECQDASTGKYKCTEQCPEYAQVPPQCHMVPDPYNPCCTKPYCDFHSHSGGVTGTGAPTTPATPAVCVYNGASFKQGETWQDGCDLFCSCDDAQNNVYRCNERCANYDVPSTCSMITDPKDVCCKVPYCQPMLPPTLAPGVSPGSKPTPFPYPIPVAVPGKIHGQTVNRPNTNNPNNETFCFYNNKNYKLGETWQDGCQYDCVCDDNKTGRYTCSERCAPYTNVPAYCSMVSDPKDSCCQVPVCVPPGQLHHTPQPNPSGSPSPNSLITPAPQPMCVYKGKSYIEGQQWFDGCDKTCVCEDADTNYYACRSRCFSYKNVSPQCRMVPDPRDPTCCQVPECTPTPGPGGFPTPGPGMSPTPFVVTNPPGVVTGIAPTPTPGPGGQTPLPRQACIYKGREYRQGERWQDGCEFNCVCEDETIGKYKCDERCASYPFIPPQCSLQRDLNDICCQTLKCDYSKPTLSPYMTPNPNPNATPPPGQTFQPTPTDSNPPTPAPNFCLYKGVAYHQGQTWTDGCNQKCRCEDSSTGFYNCFERCASYGNPPPGCMLVIDPQDACCKVPKCLFIPTLAPGVSPNPNPGHNPTAIPSPIPTAIPGTITGQSPNHNPLEKIGYCMYKGIKYNKGQTWQDGCTYNCECLDDNTGKYKCTERCPAYVSIPSYCIMVQDPKDSCCQTPSCPGLNPIPHNQNTPTPGPNGTPAPNPLKDVCVYKGSSYTQGQQWYDGCEKVCVCEDGKTGFFRCTERCAKFSNVAPNCIMVPDSKDPQCCLAPQCDQTNKTLPTGVLGHITGYGLPPTPKPQASPVPGASTPTPGVTLTPPLKDVCVYKGNSYKQGQRWKDGCDYTCVCDDGVTGKYTCTDTCVRYPNLPYYCQMVYDPTNPCCKTPKCTEPNPSLAPGQTPPPGTTKAPSSSFCVYNGIPHQQGTSWNDGCDKVCRCEDSMTNQIDCDDRCKTYPPAPNCVMMTDPNDICCQIPNCAQPNKNNPSHTIKGVPGTITGHMLPPDNLNPLPLKGQCLYHGKYYKTGEKWEDGCTYYCECVDGTEGKYVCTEKCPAYPAIPSYCTMMQDPTEPCCETPYCPTLMPPLNTLYPTPYPIGFTPYPGATPYPGPSKYPWGYTPSPGATPYLGPTPYPIGYIPYPGATPYPGPTPYPIGFTPSPGATPYLGPTPYPIGFIPYPGATPYPGPSRYPIGFIPSPGATPYLGPTPYPIGYTPYPGATPYPGPSKWPIGFTPSPGATPYLGPTPYPIGYTPSPGATPYPGPSKWPIGFIPYPGATPYLGPTPYPIGYTPSPGATPYLGPKVPTPYPIGFTPSPGATPYLGPTPYPIGFTPYPGATPYPGPQRYPIGFTPSPGATPYLGPTPYPIGFIPFPGATPYPGPSKYPIGSIPFPGGTPYLGPTPYPIGYIPYPGATPYPGPSKYPIGFTPSPGATPYLGPTPYPIGYIPWPGATPYPGPSKYPIGFTPSPGATPYLGPTPYPIGFVPYPGATPYPGPTPYPIGYTPSPGATPYHLPTPWPVGYTPYPGATPYPGPTPYPIGFTPSPGATPYRPPTPWPIGFTPYPGATPYPGPSKYPIGFIPYPGATPYLGPTPYPIGYTPSPGATPYPGPSRWPIGFTPSPGATPYRGPTPYPIGYTPYPGATPYPGPSKWPIGFTPSPGATPYPGPTPYPVGYTPSPGATPYKLPSIPPTQTPTTPYPIGYTPYLGATPYPGPTPYPIGFTPYPGATPYHVPTPWPIGYTPYPGATPYPGPSKYPIGFTPSPGATPYLGPTPWPIGYTPFPGATPYPGPTRYPIGFTPSPGATPYAGPTPWPIGFTPSPGATPYLGPTPYPIGYIPYPGATPYPGPSKYPIGFTPSPGATPYLGPTPYPIGYTPWPGATPYPGPSKYPIGYTPSPGATPYLGPTPYPIGFVPYPGATPYPGPTKYPIGFVPSPGATPYMGPTPYPIGFTPYPGATPYPGPTPYPIGFVPSPGATPYAGPTPYPIGFTPYPGATPYPGPSKYPIGFTPSPGATPYLGPTPYPIGFTPYPGATPYPGPSKYPIGFIPYPGATPYLGPTPYPIGYTPSPGATPYPGPSRWPIGFVPSPGATPYRGPTPYPIGYTPYPGATPYPGPSRWPIGFTPSPGATPYPGPTPYPVGYTPSPGATPYKLPSIPPTQTPTTPYPIGYTPYLGATPYPGPTPYPIGFTPYPGATPYHVPTPWPIGYTPYPGATPYPGPSKYPIGFTPSPGATPYLGPTPYPIGYTPYPGATPYPGPSRYPLYFTPSPGATPYLGPTPYPIGYTPYPGATPYPGPNKYPIGFTPSPGATPYPGPTPYPIGFTPYPGATPYPGPTPYPIGFTPSPGATPYMGPKPVPGVTPTPWPIGYTPYPGATPYPGPTPYPIGFTPSPGATPYHLPTPWPVGYTPYPGATPYPGPTPYPIGFTPSPGATPYRPPTPWPIGFTPYPGATPYPGPTPYPVGFTPSPGATPYRPPTPWPIGFTPYPGATPYPGPTPYPIGFTPSPGATPYLGPTKYPIGFTPSPGATPYLGPMLHPWGFTPSPGATPYYGPTPYPIGYTPWPGATPYPGPTPYPIGFTPSPGATPYLGPTPYPIGFIPYPGATPYPGPSRYPLYFTPSPGATPYLGPTPYPIGYIPYPGATPYPGPSRYPIGFIPSPGATPYPGPTPYPIGFTPYPGATPYPGPTPYPIGFTPSPGATPYHLPTPWPIGFTPYPGATPYPGPSKYPIGYTPSPGATPYLGPTPYPIGFTPSPGATPYPGPSRWPIGFIPYPGATPYLGPTPYPIGFTPSPGATPYPGPSKYPFGFIPYPGATPYLGPTPYPIGYTPSLGATPYAGPSRYPIGFTPSPGATPYLGPTPYPIGYTPFPGATPYPGPTPIPGWTPYHGTPTQKTLAPTPKDLCRYNNEYYKQGQLWYDGCSKICRCEDASTNFYRCQDRCTKYDNIAPECIMVPDPRDPSCCLRPECAVPTPGPGLTPTPGFIVTPAPGFINGYGKPPTVSPLVSPSPGSNVIPTPLMGCMYKNVLHQQGKTWQDGCDFYCECIDGSTGQYRCKEQCPAPPPLPKQCIMLPDPNNACCTTPFCDFLNPIPFPGGLPTANPNLTPPQNPNGHTTQRPGQVSHMANLHPTDSTGFCMYKGVPYHKGQSWTDACDKTCVCDDPSSNLYTCKDRCPVFSNLPASCTLETDPNDPCCLVPDCNHLPPLLFTPKPPVGTGGTQGPLSPNTTYGTIHGTNPQLILPTSIPGSYTGTGSGSGQGLPIPLTGGIVTGHRDVCVYKSNAYLQGQKWQDGCDYNCECIDAARGRYKCSDRCGQYYFIPPQCRMIPDPKDTCCTIATCDTNLFFTPKTPAGFTGSVTPIGPDHSSGSFTGSNKPVTPTDGGGFVGSGSPGSINTQFPLHTGSNQPVTPTNGGGFVGSGSPGAINTQFPVHTGSNEPVTPTSGTGFVGSGSPGSINTQFPVHTGSNEPVTPTSGTGFAGSGSPGAINTQYPVHTGSNQPVTPTNGGGLSGSGSPLVPGTAFPAYTGSGSMCMYTDGKYYAKGAQWNDGCMYNCVCNDPVSNDYKCTMKCAGYSGLPSFCSLETDPADTCCKRPVCTYNGKTYIPVTGNYLNPGITGTMSPSIQNVIPIGGHQIFSGSGVKPGQSFTSQAGGRNACYYKGTVYQQGKSWDDGCDWTCTCQVGMYGQYRCISKCPSYPATPSYCQYQTVPGQCCRSLQCNVPGISTPYNPVPQINPNPIPTAGPGLTPAPTGKTPQQIVGPGMGGQFGGSYPGGGYPVPAGMSSITMGMLNKCIYKNKMYNQGETWYDGCDYSCECLDSRTGYYKCTQRCADYTQVALPSQCYLVTGTCCQFPVCQKPDGSLIDPIKNPGIFPVVGTFNGGFTGFKPNFTPTYGNVGGSIAGRLNACLYKGKIYKQGEKWDDGCDFNCECVDETIGKYRCTPKCPIYTQMPPMCHLRTVANQCCQQVSCDTPTTQTPVITTQTPGICIDKIDNCASYGKYACNDPYKTWAHSNCPAYCGFCVPDVTTPPPACLDKLTNCPLYGHQACGGIYSAWAHENCRAYCGICMPAGSTPAPVPFKCGDKLTNCNTYGRYACVGQYEPWARDNCAGYCGYCDGSNVHGVQTTMSPPHFTTRKAVVGSSNVCFYHNKVYQEGESWIDGCDYNCTCKNGKTGFYECRDLCPTYTDLPSGCVLVKKPGECCSKPQCPQQPGGNGICYYKGQNYEQDKTWKDGCDYKCSCVDASKGFYKCQTLCLQWQLPSNCTMKAPEPGKCCPKPSCPPGFIINYPPNYVDE